VFRIYCVVFTCYLVSVNGTIDVVLIFGCKSPFKKIEGRWERYYNNTVRY